MTGPGDIFAFDACVWVAGADGWGLCDTHGEPGPRSAWRRRKEPVHGRRVSVCPQIASEVDMLEPADRRSWPVR